MSDATPAPASREVRAELLAPSELDAALAEAPVAYLPLGSLEFHGPHLPIGLDSLNAHGVCVGAAQRFGGIVLPTVYQGLGGGHTAYPWTIMVEAPYGVVAHLTTTLTRLEEFGVKTAVVFTGHFADEQLAMVDALAATWNEGERGMHVLASGVNRCDTAPLAPDHAGVFETTLLAAIAPELVHLDLLPSAAEHPAIDPSGDVAGPQRHDPSHPLWGVFGPDPRGADLGLAPALYDHLVEWLGGLVRDGAR
ncbi:creatininase family protein [Frondihabitans cladoniiphilus]|uniref:Creatinine amidohydrolase n=1 Tax=Frondihabitans cladoniiphilus TaxID=715785 RepID=A0ABP8VKB9_9MICO